MLSTTIFLPHFMSQVYNGLVYDLLSDEPNQRPLPILDTATLATSQKEGNQGGGVEGGQTEGERAEKEAGLSSALRRSSIAGLSVRTVESAEQVMSLLRQGRRNRRVRSTEVRIHLCAVLWCLGIYLPCCFLVKPVCQHRGVGFSVDPARVIGWNALVRVGLLSQSLRQGSNLRFVFQHGKRKLATNPGLICPETCSKMSLSRSSHLYQPVSMSLPGSVDGDRATNICLASTRVVRVGFRIIDIHQHTTQRGEYPPINILHFTTVFTPNSQVR